MGRKRIISDEQILDAAQHVVGRDGAGQLTVDAVATQAGISKASVLYFYKSKKALIEATVQRIVRLDREVNEAAIRSLDALDGAVVRGRILAAADWMPEASRSVALDLCAAAAQDPKLRRPAQEFQNSIIARIQKTCAHARGAMLAHLALEGLKLLELLDFHIWPKDERNRLLQDIEWLISVDPGPSGSLQKNASSVAVKQSGPVKKKRGKSASATTSTKAAGRGLSKNSGRPVSTKTRA
ncbi:TetR/AcrR family transcriptional regulator [Tunturiibacter gelidiferens]|uniref:TetR/AcrR family transcriptional regulator n=1 Tax=Tunturiibacter gelidiferens TaxID=3069689 RepID=UPI003D9B0DC4